MKVLISIIVSFLILWIFSYLCWEMFQLEEPNNPANIIGVLFCVLYFLGMFIASVSPAWILGLIILACKLIFNITPTNK